MERYRVAITILFRLLVGSVFVVAGEMKLYDSLVGYLSSDLRVAGINLIPWLGATELVVGILLLAGIAPFVVNLAVVALLCSFVTYSAVFWGLGNARCGCFGEVPVAPGHILVLDLGLLALSLAALHIHALGATSRRISDRLPADSQTGHNPIVATILIWIVLSVLPGSSIAAEPSLRDRFLQEFPAAHRRLRDAALHAEGDARYLRTDDLANRGVKNREDMKWGSFLFVTRNDSLRIDQIVAGGGTTTNASLVLTPGFNFRVLSPNSSSAQLVDVSREVEGELTVTHALYWRDFFPACFMFAEASLEEWMERPGFELETVEADAGERELVHVTFRWDGAEWWPNQSPPADYVHTGEWWLSPAQDWAIRRTAYRYSYSYEANGQKKVDLTSVSAVVDVQEIPRLGFVPRRVEITEKESTSDWSALKTIRTSIFEFENVRKSTAGDEVFTPAALGVGDPRSTFSVWFIVLNAGIILLLLSAWTKWKRR